MVFARGWTLYPALPLMVSPLLGTPQAPECPAHTEMAEQELSSLRKQWKVIHVASMSCQAGLHRLSYKNASGSRLSPGPPCIFVDTP